MTCKTCLFCRKSLTKNCFICDLQGGWKMPDLRGCKRWEAKR